MTNSKTNPNALPSDTDSGSTSTAFDGEAIAGGLNSGGQIHERSGDPMRVTTAPIQSGGLVARTPDGFRISNPADLRPDSVVTIPGYGETSYEVAVSTGLMNPAGGVANQGQQQQTDEGDPSAQQDETQQQTMGDNTSLDETSEKYLTEAFAASTDAAVFAATDILNSDGQITSDAVENIAVATGVEPEVARQRIEHVTRAYEQEAAQVTAKAQGTSEELVRDALQAARQVRPSDLREAAMNHFQSGRPGYETFVQDYIATLDQRDAAYILNSNPVPGRKVHFDDAHNVVVVTDTTTGRTYRWEDAVRMRLIGIK